MHLQNQRLNVILSRENLQLRPRQRCQKFSVGSHSWIAAGAEPNAHQFLCHDLINGGGHMERDPGKQH
jgi:hypothetical protein